jgi:nicotinamidase-related amidase
MVVHLQNDGLPGSVDAVGTPGWQLAMEPSREDFVVRKAVDDGFEGTTLAEVLGGGGVDRLVIAGVLSEMCVAGTARSALARGFEVWLPHDAHTTYDTPSAEWHPNIVPAEAVSRVAEWSLGDEIHLVAHAEQVDLSS